ncbi:MAG: hypothetical protein BGO96_11845 [Micrococcales bacterium 73-15]|uniref:DUF2264 domain-containing protein n=1 Tax=Salana multivorans TaxID=120377 RepID=UPI000959191E|nr:DUF2264 domain-containing protein [Salana multivorans]OJX95492.1 MAG: hypothetical protein BGO96_11845 [Micrococcales bacterium 73-15]
MNTTQEQTLGRPEADAAPYWSREQWQELAASMLRTAQRYASPRHGRITYPGAEGGYGHAVDGLEGFARTFLVAGFLVAGNRGEDPEGFLDWFAEGVAAGTDPDADPQERWVRLDEHDQAKVEAASLALVLDLTRPWLWDRLDAVVQRRVVEYLSPVVGDETYPRNNWLWFRVVVQTFLRSVGGPWSADDIRSDLARHDSYVQADGWLTDGTERAYDHYVGWALHLYPTLWARMSGAEDLAADRVERDRAALDRFLADALALVGGDGSPLIQGRSLIYRFAAAAPYWVGAIAEVPSHPLGQLRAAANAVVAHFADRGIPGEGFLTMGWHDEWRELAQSYSGPSSPYWATKGLVGLLLPADHPVWSAPRVALPVEQGVARYVAAPAWAISGTADDGIVRIANHGSDHASLGADTGDSPLYARLGYSTATFPLLDAESWVAPLDQAVVLVDAAGRRTHRAGMAVLAPPAAVTDPEGSDVVTAASRADAHWITPAEQQVRHGSGVAGEVAPAGELTTVSVLRGAWEVRLVHVAAPAPEALALELGGWPLAGNAGEAAAEAVVAVTSGPAGPADEDEPGASAPAVALASGGRTAELHALDAGWDGARVERRRDASPLGAEAAVGVLTAAPAEGWHAAAIALTGTSADGAVIPGEPPRLTLTDSHARVAWADGVVTTVTLPTIPAAGGQRRSDA